MLSAVAVDAQEARPVVGLGRLSDELLALRSARGGERAFQAVYERYHQTLYQYCRSILRHDADAQDALQSTFAKALVALRAGQRSAPLRPWLFRIAHNEAISIIRTRRHNQPSELLAEDAGLAVGSAEDEVGAREEWSALVRDLAQLPAKQRGALLQRELNGLSHEEIATALGTSAGAAKQLIFEARQGLAELVEGREMECSEVRRRISDGDRRILRGRKVSSHLRSCAGCAAFADAIPARTAELRAAVPVLAPAAAAELFTRVLRGAGGHGAASASAAGSAAAVAKVAGGGLLWKALAGGVILATAAFGVTKLAHASHRRGAPAPAHHALPPRPEPGASGRVISAGPRHVRRRTGAPRALARHRRLPRHRVRAAVLRRRGVNAGKRSSPPPSSPAVRVVHHPRVHRAHHPPRAKSPPRGSPGLGNGAGRQRAGEHAGGDKGWLWWIFKEHHHRPERRDGGFGDEHGVGHSD